MKKFFIAICFVLLTANNIQARITPIGDYQGSLKRSQNSAQPKVHIVDYDEFASFLEKQLEKAIKISPASLKSDNIGYSKNNAEQEDNRSIFEKIYDKAMDRVTKSTSVKQNNITTGSPTPAPVNQQMQLWQAPSVSTITIPLPPYNRPAKVPAQEHIPYSMTTLEILNNGLVKIQETVVVLANGKKVTSDLTKILPLAVYDGNTKRVLDYSLISVSRNDVPVDYKLSSDGQQVFIAPYENNPLPTGVYTYNFEYLVDNMLIEKDDYYITYWNVGGNGWNLIIDRLGATLLLPQRDTLLEQQVFFGTDNNLYRDGVRVMRNGMRGFSFIADRPLFIGEGMYIVTKIDKSAVYPFGLWQKFLHTFYTYGDIIISALGLSFIMLCLLTAWHYIKIRKNLQKISLPKTPTFMRTLLTNKFDMETGCSFILEMYRKNIIDIQQSGTTILLIKRTDNLKNLNKDERAALNQFFPEHETIFNVNPNNKLKFNRFMQKLKTGIKKQLNIFYFKINRDYALINIAMLWLIEGIIAYFKISSWRVFAVLSGVTFIIFVALGLWNWQLPKWKKIFVRLLIINICVAGLMVMSMVISPLAAGLLLLTTIAIVTALHFYVSRFGLIKYYIDNVKDYRDTLLKNADNIILGKNFINYQAAVWALDLSDDIVPIKTEEYHKIPTIKAIIATMKN